MNLRPDLLLHPNIPMPLHGLNPRTLKGREWWDAKRQAAYAKNNYCCWACGVHKSEALYRHVLEAHEDYVIDYANGRMTIKEIVALCPACHGYIHSGRLEAMYLNGEIGVTKFVEILRRGTEILIDNDLPLNPFAKRIMSVYRMEPIMLHPQPALEIPETIVAWGDWRLVLDGVEYAPLWLNESEHVKHYGGLR